MTDATTILTQRGFSRATVSQVLRRAGLSMLSDLQPKAPVQHYEREAPGELLHIDIKKLGRFEWAGVDTPQSFASFRVSEGGT